MADSTLPSLDAIQARADAATEGPWDYYCTHHPSGRHAVYLDSGMGTQDVTVEAVEPDAEFIAHARTDVPVLVAALRAALAIHRPEKPRRDPDFHHTDRVCIECGDAFPCRTYTALTAHIDTTPKEKP